MAPLAFGEFVLDPDTRALLRDGSPVALSPKAFQLLGILAESRPRALSKGDLQERLWPGTFVVEKNLTNLVSEIRAALQDDSARPRFIRTIPRFGYAFHAAAGEPHERASTSEVEARHNLPEPPAGFVGRSTELAELGRLVLSTRLVTLTGAGGCGKTRLALEVARRALDSFRDGAWLVELAPISDESLVAPTVAAVLDVRQEPGRSLHEALVHYLRSRKLLLLLDNCEHLIGSVARLADELLRGAAGLTILATSREALGIAGETVWRVPSLAHSEAVELLRGSASARGTPLHVTEQNAATIAEVCRRLDGIPLALELAAARLSTLSIEQIRDRLDDRFRLLTVGSRTALARQRTLRAAVDWSYDLLSKQERSVFARLSVFAGGFSLEAAEDVCSDDSDASNDRDETIDHEAVLDLLTRLAEKSLLNVTNTTGHRLRYAFLDTIRQYARERLAEAGGLELTRARHARVFLDLAKRAEPELTSSDQARWLGILELENDNLRAALEWSLDARDESAQGLELAAALWWFWLKQGHFAEGRQWLERALGAAPESSAALRAKALLGQGSIVFFQGDFARSRSVLAESATHARATSDWASVSFARGIESLAALELGDLKAAERLAEEGRSAGRMGPSRFAQGPSLSFFAYQALHAGDLEQAGRLHEEIIALCRERGETWGMRIALFDLGLLRVLQDRTGEARALCHEGLALCRPLADRPVVAWFLGVLAGAEAAEGHARPAATLRGAMQGLLDALGSSVQPTFKMLIDDRFFGEVQRVLGDGPYQHALAEGRAMSPEAAIAYGLEDRH